MSDGWPESLRTYDVCGLPIAATSPSDAANAIVAACGGPFPFEVHLCNVFTLSLVDSDKELRNALAQADLNLPDGAPVAWLGRRHGVRRPVRGPRLVTDVAIAGQAASVKHYLYGGDVGVAEAVAQRLRDVAPAIQLAGTETPPFHDLSPEALAALAERIMTSGAELVWVGLGTPRQDYLVPRLASATGLVVVPVGAAFDFLSGRVPEAPKFLHGSGLEWLYRLRREPRRLWRRYLLGNPRFVVSVMRHAYRGNTH